MSSRPLALLATATLAALSGCASHAEQKAAARPAAAAAAAAEPEPSSPEALLPGIALDKLSDAQKAVVAAWSKETFCYCGCPHTVSQCLRTHGGCHHAKRMARLGVYLAASEVAPRDLAKLVTDYYAAFDAPKRAKLELAAYGPPLGEPGAKIALVEFSDFTCPFCQLFRPVLEKWVTDRPGRVKLYYMPFPIESHPDALQAAQAAEWAREKGVFWQMHDLLFASPHAPPSELVGMARDLGQDGADLEAALASGRLLPKVRASQAAGRAAGLRATPTVYLEGRRMPDTSDFMLELALQDEEEWQQSGGWGRDQGN